MRVVIETSYFNANNDNAVCVSPDHGNKVSITVAFRKGALCLYLSFGSFGMMVILGVCGSHAAGGGWGRSQNAPQRLFF